MNILDLKVKDLKMHVVKKFHKKIFSFTDFIKSLAKTAHKRQSKYK